MNKHRHYKFNDQLEAVEVDGEWIILHPNEFTITKVNPIGGFICSALKEPGTIITLSQKIQEQYAVSAETAEADIRLFLDELMRVGLVEYAS